VQAFEQVADLSVRVVGDDHGARLGEHAPYVPAA
jgi:hypothetical protein